MSFVLFNQCQGAFYNRSSKYTFAQHSYKFNILMCLLLRILSCLAFYVVIFIKALKNCTGSISKVSTISFNLLISYFLVTQLWIFSHHISLRGDIKLNLGLKQDINQCFSVCHWNLNSIPTDNFSQIQSLIVYKCIH